MTDRLTAGDWRYASDVSQIWTRCERDVRGKPEVRNVLICNLATKTEEKDANGYTLAAAKDMRKALESLIRCWQGREPATPEMWADARAALTKARGKI